MRKRVDETKYSEIKKHAKAKSVACLNVITWRVAAQID
jgi:hypothetical protein